MFVSVRSVAQTSGPGPSLAPIRKTSGPICLLLTVLPRLRFSAGAKGKCSLIAELAIPWQGETNVSNHRDNLKRIKRGVQTGGQLLPGAGRAGTHKDDRVNHRKDRRDWRHKLDNDRFED